VGAASVLLKLKTVSAREFNRRANVRYGTNSGYLSAPLTAGESLTKRVELRWQNIAEKMRLSLEYSHSIPLMHHFGVCQLTVQGFNHAIVRLSRQYFRAKVEHREGV
jgi:hypothetical protein